MLSVNPGHDVGYLTGEVAGGREGYYTGAVAAGEPDGLWYGAGAEALGLTGVVDADLMEAVYTNLLDPRDPAAHSRSTWGEAEGLAAAHRKYRSAGEIYADLLTSHPGAGPEERAELRTRAERSARQAVSFYDATFSAPKSVTVLGVAFERAENDARAAGDLPAAEAWATHRRAVEDAVMAGARASVDYLADVAGYSRIGHHGGGAGRWIDAHDFVVAQFLQHDSRDRDPQLHVHQAILNRVQCSDGTWRAVDGKAIMNNRGAAGAVGERVMEAHLARSLGVEFAARPDGNGREVLGVSQEVMDLFSSRRQAITAKSDELVRAFTERFGRDPQPHERNKIAQQATLATRAAKSHDGETLEQRLDRWEAEARQAVAGGLAGVAQAVLDRGQSSEPAQTWSPEDVIERALATAAERRSSWTRSDLTRAISDALPGHLDLNPERVRELLDGLTDQAVIRAVRLSVEEDTAGLSDDLLLANGSSVYARPGAAKYTTEGQIAAERELRKAAVVRGAAAFTADEAAAVVTRFAESGRGLGADQAAAVRGILSSGARVEVLSAAAGTGKSFTVGAIAGAWVGAGHRVVGLAPSQVAAMVLVDEGLDEAMNVSRWLGSEQTLAPGDLVVVDEAGMTSTADLARIHARVAAADAKMLLVGDPRQLAAVGPGGALADLGEHGLRYELAEVRRFNAGWERAASLQLREGNTAALDDYQRHGRIVDGGAREQAEAAAARAWLADTLAGRESLLIVGSNDAAARVSGELRAQLVALGRVEERGAELTSHGNIAGVGDRVEARRNGWDLIGHDGNTRAPINRETYTVTEVLDDGGLRVVDDAGVTRTLPRQYVAEHLALGYATTAHGTQGRTADTAHAVIGPSTDAAGVYVPLTRGRERNTAYVVTAAVPQDAQTGEVTAVEARAGRAVLADILERDRQDRTALAEQEQAELDAVSTVRHVDRLAAEIADVTAGRVGTILDGLAAADALTEQERTELAADPAYGGLERLLRTCELAGHEPAAVLTEAVTERSLDGAQRPAQVLHARITQTLGGVPTPQLNSYADLIPADVPEDRRERLERLAEDADDRRRELGAQAAQDGAQWAVESLGSVPEDAVARAEWEQRAGWAAAYRELAGHADEQDPLGAAPPAGLAENYAAWHAGHAALDLPDRGADEQQMTDGRLRVRVAAYERELAWAPTWVGEDLATAHQTAEKHRTDAEVWAARADVTEDPTEREQLQLEAARARTEAESLTQRATELEAADEARASWYVHTSVTRDNADRARAELAARGVDLNDPQDQVTAEEWLAEHVGAQLTEDDHREIGELDMLDEERDLHSVDTPVDQQAVETDVADTRDLGEAPATEREDIQHDRIPTLDETAAAVARAQEALAEIEARRAADAAREAEENLERARSEELSRWAEVDRASEQTSSDEMVLEY